MSSWLSNSYVTTLVNRLFFNVAEYLSGKRSEGWDGSEFIDPLVEDDGNEEYGDNCEVRGDNDAAGNNDDLGNEKEKEQRSITINIQNTEKGIVVVGDNTSISCRRGSRPSSGATSSETEVNRASGTKNPFKDVQQKNASFPVSEFTQYPSGEFVLLEKNDEGNENSRRKTRKKKRNNCETSKPKVSSLITRIEYIRETLSRYRENGEWEKHDEFLDELMKNYKHDEDNHDIALQLKYEKALGFFARHEISKPRKIIGEVVKEITANGIHAIANDTQKWIYVLCLLLVSDIYLREKKYGKAQKALRETHNFFDKYFPSHFDLKAEFHLAHARYHLQQLHQSRSPLTGVKKVIEETNRAKVNVDEIMKQDRKTWENTSRKILLTRSRAIIAGQIPEQFVETLTASLNEIEDQLWSGILPNTKVEYQTLKCDYFRFRGNSERALDFANHGLEISRNCGFTAAAEQLQRRIHEIHNYPTLRNAQAESDELVAKVRGMITSDSGNLESNAVQPSDIGVFSTDEFSDWDTYDFLSYKQGNNQIVHRGHLLEGVGEGRSEKRGETDVKEDEDEEKEEKAEGKREAEWGGVRHIGRRSGHCGDFSGIVQDVKGGDGPTISRRRTEKETEARGDEETTQLQQFRPPQELQHQPLQRQQNRGCDEKVGQDLPNNIIASNCESGGVERNEDLEVFCGSPRTCKNVVFDPLCQDLTADGGKRSTDPFNVPDNEKLTEKEQTKLALLLGSHWIVLLGLLNMDYEIQQNISRSNNLFPDLPSKAKEVLHLYNKREDFSRKVLAKLVEQDLKLPEEAEAILIARYRD